MKRFIVTGWLLFALLFNLLACPALADAPVDGVLTLPRDVTDIADEAFAGDTSIATVMLSDECVSIGSRAFAGCTQLAALYAPDSLVSISEDAFEGCASLVIWGYAGSYAQTFADKHGIPFQSREVPGEYKIAIMTGSTAQGEEEYAAVTRLSQIYGERILHVTYPDDFIGDVEITIAKLLAFAEDPDVKAIIVAQAVYGTSEAFSRIRELRDDILLVAIVPGESPDEIASAADIVITSDDLAAGDQIAALARKWGCDAMVHYSFPRHMSYESIAAKCARIQSGVEAAGIAFENRTCIDPTVNFSDALDFIREDVAAVMAEHPGQKVGFYCTNCGLQAALQEAVLEQENAYYTLPCCPSPFHGFPDAFGLSGSYSDIAGMLNRIANFLGARGALNRFSTWAAPVNMAMVEGSFAYAMAWAEGELTSKVNATYMKSCIADAVGSGASISSNGSYGNYLLVALEAIDFSDFVTGG